MTWLFINKLEFDSLLINNMAAVDKISIPVNEVIHCKTLLLN